MPIPFRLYQVPTVVMMEVLKLIRIKELITLSMCSKRIRHLIKRLRNKSIDWQIQVNGLGDGRSAVTMCRGRHLIGVLSCTPKKDHFPFEDPRETLKMGNFVVPFMLGRKITYLRMYWENPKDGTKAIVDYITDLFDSPVHVLYSLPDDIWIIDLMNHRQEQKLEKTVIENIDQKPFVDENLDNILTTFHATKQLCLRIRPSADFRFNKNFPSVDHLYFVYGHWITLENLKTIDSIEVFIERSKITTTDCVDFLRNWMTGGCQRMKYVRFGVEEVDVQRVKDDIRGVQVNEMRRYRMPRGQRIFPSGYDIRRVQDGVKATIDFTSTHFISMAVWPDSDNNYG